MAITARRAVRVGLPLTVKATAQALTLIAVAFAGCTGEPAQPQTRLADVGDTQSGASEETGFNLRVSVRGLGGKSGGLPDTPAQGIGPTPGRDLPKPGDPTSQMDGTEPIGDALVSAWAGSEPLAKGTTSVEGIVDLILKPDQTLRLVAIADGWTHEESVPIRLPPPGSAPPSNETCGALDKPCLAVRSDAASSVELGGEQGAVRLFLFQTPNSIQHVYTVGGRLHVADLVLPPNQKPWSPYPTNFTLVPEFDHLYNLRLRGVNATLNWTNSPTDRTLADFELGVGCSSQAPEVKTDGGPYLTDVTGSIRIPLAWKSALNGSWSSCAGFYAGPYTDTLNSATTVTLKLEFTYEGPASQSEAAN